jgi:putative copper export protein
MVAALAIAVAAPLAGHPVSVPDEALLAVALDAIHVLAVGGWLGALAVLVLAVIPAAFDLLGSARYDTIRRVFVAFTPVALASAALLVLSGAGGALLQLGGIEPLLTSTYGRLLLVKVGIVLFVAVLGLLNWRRFVPGVASSQGLARYRKSAGAELVLGVLALLVTAVLAATTPPTGGMP